MSILKSLANSINIENQLNSYFIGAANVLSQDTLGSSKSLH